MDFLPIVPTARYRPRPNDPLRGDMQEAFFESDCEGPTFLLGGTGAGTTFTACAKVVKFLMEQEPPRRDTPFWIISETYETVCKAIWKEKLSPVDGYGLLPATEIQWERIRWYKPKEGWPFDVYLKPHPGCPGKNWVLSFKSYAQGRQNMQAESIGGFMFSEQFPWGLLNEVMGRCREYDFKGNKICEFTPVEASLSTELREMEETGTIPEDWGLFRANTEVALEAGHVSQQWFKQFYPMLSDQMRVVRMKGLWGGFDGAIYPEFSPEIHCVPEDWEPTLGMDIRRGIDWGFSLDHPLVCLWAARNSIGQWFVFDEYWSNDTSLSAVEHLCAIADQREWPSDIYPTFGTTWVDHNLDCVRIASKLGQYAPGYSSLNCQLAAKSVDEGIEHVKYLLKPTLAIDPDKPPQPRLFISKRCRHLINEMRSYRRHKTTATGPNVQAAVDAPVKMADDAPDALRYILFSEAEMSGMTPSTVARQHNPSRHGVHVVSSRFNGRGGR